MHLANRLESHRVAAVDVVALFHQLDRMAVMVMIRTPATHRMAAATLAMICMVIQRLIPMVMVVAMVHHRVVQEAQWVFSHSQVQWVVRRLFFRFSILYTLHGEPKTLLLRFFVKYFKIFSKSLIRGISMQEIEKQKNAKLFFMAHLVCFWLKFLKCSFFT